MTTPKIHGITAKQVQEIGIPTERLSKIANAVTLTEKAINVAHALPVIPNLGIRMKLKTTFATADRIAAIIEIYVVDVAFEMAE